jgi:hypothetical protein
MITLESRIIPTLARSTACGDDYVFHVFREVWIKDWGLTGFFLVLFAQRDALGNAVADRLGSMENGHRPLAIFNNDLRARAS